MTLSKKKNFLEKIIKLEKAFMLLKKPHVEILIEKILYQIKKTLNKKGKIIFCGNGGSASDSLHLTAELVGRFKKNRKALPAISLNSEISSITAIANDFGYENIFKRQFQALAKKNDLLIAFSTSGRSKNIILIRNLLPKIL